MLTKFMKAAGLSLLFAMPAFAAVTVGTGSATGLLHLLIYIVVVGLIFWAVWWFISYVGIPEPFNKVIRVIVGLFALVIVINLLLGLIGSPLF